MTIRPVLMDFLYGGTFRTGIPEAYERLILDVMLGDATLFTRADEVDEEWSLVDAIVAFWRRDKPVFPNYEAGTWGPLGSDELIQRDARSGADTDVTETTHVDEWQGDDVSLAEVQRRLGELRLSAAGATPICARA